MKAFLILMLLLMNTQPMNNYIYKLLDLLLKLHLIALKLLALLMVKLAQEKHILCLGMLNKEFQVYIYLPLMIYFHFLKKANINIFKSLYLSTKYIVENFLIYLMNDPNSKLGKMQRVMSI